MIHESVTTPHPELSQTAIYLTKSFLNNELFEGVCVLETKITENRLIFLKASPMLF
jgi:hypothetical protein